MQVKYSYFVIVDYDVAFFNMNTPNIYLSIINHSIGLPTVVLQGDTLYTG